MGTEAVVVGRAGSCLLAIVLLAGGCGDGGPAADGRDGGTTDDGTTDDGDGGDGGTTDDAGTEVDDGDGPGPDGGDGGTTPAGPFRYGVNFGHRNGAWGDDLYADLARGAGANGARISLPETHLERWGYEIEVADMRHYAEVGLRDHVAFLTSPIRGHSTAPASAADGELAYWIPRNLHEPITLPSGEINPDNYWAAYVYRTVSVYKEWVGVWEIWNEPDWVSDGRVVERWATEAPTADELPRFHGSVFDYVRMLRVSREAARMADPDARIAVGGLGYPNFLAALLRSTDNPVDGGVDAEHPFRGDVYFDVLSIHYYPLWTPGSSEAAADGLLHLQAEFQAVLDEAGRDGAGVTGKAWTCTEIGAPHVALADAPGGPEYARNFLVKAMTLGQAAGFEGLDWFLLTDGAAPGASTSAFDSMGLYEDIVDLATTDEATLTGTGCAYATLGGLLEGAAVDGPATAGLVLPPGARGVAFRRSDGTRAWVLWAVPAGTDETAAATVSLAPSRSLWAFAWDDRCGGEPDATLPSVGGRVTVDLDGSPLILVEPAEI
jgi:hypothetical protein